CLGQCGFGEVACGDQTSQTVGFEATSEFSDLLSTNRVKPAFCLHLNLPSTHRPAEPPECSNDIYASILGVSGDHHVLVAGRIESLLDDEFEVPWMKSKKAATHPFKRQLDFCVAIGFFSNDFRNVTAFLCDRTSEQIRCQCDILLDTNR